MVGLDGRSAWRATWLVLAMGCAAPAAENTSAPAPVAVPTPEPAPGPSEVRWAEVLEALRTFVCVDRYEEPGEEPFTSPGFGATCERPEPTEPLLRAALKTWADAQPYLISLKPEKTAAQQLVADQAITEELVAQVRDIYLGDRFVRGLLPRLGPALEAEGLRCTDCPSPAPPPERHTDWDTLRPYVTAYVWPDPVVTPRDDRGKPTGPPRYSMHVCVGINGIAQLTEPDPLLVQAAYLGTVHSEVVAAHAVEHFQALLAEPAFKKLRRDTQRTEYLRRELPPRIAADPELRADVCTIIAGFRDDLGLIVDGCP